MAKTRVYEVAKELNTSSKRLMEKLAEINIEVKNHMSLLQENELEALYNHIGVIKKDESKKAEDDESKAKRVVKEVAKERKNAPRIIRTTEIIVDSKNDSVEVLGQAKRLGADTHLQNKINNQNKARAVVVESENAGLRAGFVRGSEQDYKTTTKSEMDEKYKKETYQAEQNKEIFISREKAKASEGMTAIQSLKEEQGNGLFGEATKEKVEKKEQLDLENMKMQQNQREGKIIDRNPGEQGQSINPNYRQDTGQSFNRDNRQGTGQGFNRDNRQGAGQGFNRDNRQGTGQGFNRDNRQGTGQGFNRDNRQGAGQGFNRDNRQSAGAYRTNNNKELEIPKVELTNSQKEVLNVKSNDSRRLTHTKDVERDTKREIKKDVAKPNANKNTKLKEKKIVLGEKKGIKEVLSEEYILDEFYSDDIKKLKKGGKNKKDIRHMFIQEKANIPKEKDIVIKIGDSISVKELAEALKKTSTDVIKKLMVFGTMATLNQEIDFDTACIVADEYKVKVEKEILVNEEDILFDETGDETGDLQTRPPVVVVMGHVDHGKTSLLDAMRETNVTEGEAGGITQHIGAHIVKFNNRNITFLDTPGHEAFTAMRARGAQITDIAILVVAADDGVMPQTIEAINHAKAANVTIIVAINKTDKPGANPDRVKQELTEYGLVSEEWGGDTIFVEVSAKEKTNISKLLEMILLVSDMLELKANPNRQAKGTVIEAKLEKDKGTTASMLVQRGTLKVGDSVIAGNSIGRIRVMRDDKGHKILEAGPSIPVEILGLGEVPQAGETFYAIHDEKVAKQLIEKRKFKQKEEQLKMANKVTLDDLFNQIQAGKVKDLNLIVKADVQGSVEAVRQSLVKLTTEEVRVNVVHGAVGAITESDVALAQVSNAIIIGFNVRPGTNVSEAANNAGVDIRLYRVIYNAIEDVEAAMKGMLDPVYKEVVQGHAEIRNIFRISGIGAIGGAYVTDGKILRNSEVRIIRNGVVVFDGKLASLKRFKDDAKDVSYGYECGLSIENYNDIKEGDIVESFVMEEIKV